jgi:hypothetical protein
MDKKLHYKDHPTVFPLILARIIGFLITGIYTLFMLPEFIIMLGNAGHHTEIWIFLFYALSLTYGAGLLLTFWNLRWGSFLLIFCGLGITIFGVIDSREWEVLAILLPLMLPGYLFYRYWKNHIKPA